MTTLYQRQLNYLFNRPITEPAWYWSDRWEEEVIEEEDPLSAFVLIENLLQNPSADLAPYSDNQVALGLDFVFNGAISNLACNFRIAPVPIARKTAALKALFVLFRDVFNPRCAAATSAGIQQTPSKLNGFCYMFWDVCPLSTWFNFSEALYTKKPKEIVAAVQKQYKNLDAENSACYEAIAGVMRQCLSLDNPACVESALHGLGHMALFLPDITVPIIDGYLKKSGYHDQNLRHYSRAARTGMIL